MHRFPDLCFDAADSCTGITQVERMALADSKRGIFSTVTNQVDAFSANPRVLDSARDVSGMHRGQASVHVV